MSFFPHQKYSDSSFWSFLTEPRTLWAVVGTFSYVGFVQLCMPLAHPFVLGMLLMLPPAALFLSVYQEKRRNLMFVDQAKVDFTATFRRVLSMSLVLTVATWLSSLLCEHLSDWIFGLLGWGIASYQYVHTHTTLGKDPSGLWASCALLLFCGTLGLPRRYLPTSFKEGLAQYIHPYWFLVITIPVSYLLYVITAAFAETFVGIPHIVSAILWSVVAVVSIADSAWRSQRCVQNDRSHRYVITRPPEVRS